MQYHSNKIRLILFIFAIFLIGCTGDHMKEQKVIYNSLEEVSDFAWDTLSKKKIYFGHQSVGYNIIEGIDLLKQKYSKIKINIIESEEIDKNNQNHFFHSKVGQNNNPKSKDSDFVFKMKNGIGNNVDIAFYKYCYVDVTGKSNIEEIVSGYTSTIDRLSKEYPKTKFVYMGIPLCTQEITWKTKLKQLMNKKNIWEFENNISRNKFNELLKEKVKGSNLFDIAKYESTVPDGTKEIFKTEGKEYYAMYPGYSNDGGHLNDIGKQKIAGEFLLFLINQL